MSTGMILILVGVFGILIIVGLMLLKGDSKGQKSESFSDVTFGDRQVPAKKEDRRPIEKKVEPVPEEKTKQPEVPPVNINTYEKAQQMSSNATVILNRKENSAAFLAVKKGPDFGNKYDLKAGDTTIGRDASNDVLVNDNFASEKHALIRSENGEYDLYDLASTNGTLLNGEKVIGSKQLNNNDVIAIGDIEFVFYKLA